MIEKIRNETKQKSLIDETIGNLIVYSTQTMTEDFVRQRDMDLIQDFKETADKERQNLEAIEVGRWQAELLLKTKEEQLYRELLNLHRDQSILLVNQSIDFAVKKITNSHALWETDIKNQSFKDYISENNDNLGLIIEDFVKQFLIPNVDRMKLQKKVKREEQNISEILQNHFKL